MKLQLLWGSIMPRFIYAVLFDFLWGIVLEYFEVLSSSSTLTYQAKPLARDRINQNVVENVISAFRGIHEMGVVHGDVREENILVREDKSIVIVDFERMEMNASQHLIEIEDYSVKALLSELQS